MIGFGGYPRMGRPGVVCIWHHRAFVAFDTQGRCALVEKDTALIIRACRQVDAALAIRAGGKVASLPPYRTLQTFARKQSR